MRKGTLTREQAIIEAGIDAVSRLDRENCDFTNRVQCDGDDSVEFSASVSFLDADLDAVTLTAYFYQDKEDLERCENLDELEWIVEGYEID